MRNLNVAGGGTAFTVQRMGRRRFLKQKPTVKVTRVPMVTRHGNAISGTYCCQPEGRGMSSVSKAMTKNPAAMAMMFPESLPLVRVSIPNRKMPSREP